MHLFFPWQLMEEGSVFSPPPCTQGARRLVLVAVVRRCLSLLSFLLRMGVEAEAGFYLFFPPYRCVFDDTWTESWLPLFLRFFDRGLLVNLPLFFFFFSPLRPRRKVHEDSTDSQLEAAITFSFFLPPPPPPSPQHARCRRVGGILPLFWPKMTPQGEQPGFFPFFSSPRPLLTVLLLGKVATPERKWSG